jgi:hypothetical protein
MDQESEATGYTYEDAARVCGVTAETIRLRARRGELRRGRPTNTRRPTVLLTEAEIAAIRAGRPFLGEASGQSTGQPVQPDGQPTGQPSAFVALSDHVTTLKEQLAKADARADRETEERARLLALVEGLRDDLKCSRDSRDRADVRADREAARADQADARADRAEAELARLQAPPAAIPAPEAEADLVREDELNAPPTDQLVASMAAEVARAQALVPAPTPRRGFLARLLNRKPAAPTL